MSEIAAQKIHNGEPLSPRNEVTNQRIEAFDIAKGIGMLLVVFAHVNYTPWLLNPIYSFHMPLFFILAGLVFSPNRYSSFDQFIAKRFKTIVIPYLIFSYVPILCVSLIDQHLDTSIHFNEVQYEIYHIEIIFSQSSTLSFNVPMWFIPALLVVETLYYFIAKQKMWLRIIIVYLFVRFGYYLISKETSFQNSNLIWSFDTALFAMGFYAIGHIFAPYVKAALFKIKASRFKLLICIGIILLCVAIGYPVVEKLGKISMGQRKVGNPYYLYITGILGSVAVLAGSLMVERCRFLKYLGKNSFPIMGVHYMIRKYGLGLFYEFTGITPYRDTSLRQSILPFLAVLILSILATMLYNALKKGLCRLYAYIAPKASALAKAAKDKLTGICNKC